MKIGDTAPDFEAQTTEGRIRFHDWIGDSWAVLFSHPKDFTPVCTTELGYMAKLKPEFDQRNTKIVGLSVDPVGNHTKWANDIKETQGHAPNYPMIGDTGQLEAGRGRDHRRLGVGRRSQEDIPAGVEGASALPPDRSAAQVLGPHRSKSTEGDPVVRPSRLSAVRPAWALTRR